MTIIDLATSICKKHGKSDSTSITRCIEFLKVRAEFVYDYGLWRDSMLLYTPADLSTRIVILPEQVGIIILVAQDDINLPASTWIDTMLFDPAGLTRDVGAIRFLLLPSVAVKQLPVSGEAIKIVSDNAADASVISLVGEDESTQPIEQREDLTLNGTTEVTGTKTWGIPFIISKRITTGTITVKDATTGNTLVTLLPNDYQRKHQRIQLLDKPASNVTLTFLCKRAFRPPANDSEAFLIRDTQNALRAFGEADFLEYMKQYAKAATKVSEGLAMLKTAEDKQKQGAGSQRIYLTAGGEVGDLDMDTAFLGR